MKLLLEHQEENINWFLEERKNKNKFLAIFPKQLEKIGQFFSCNPVQVKSILAIHTWKCWVKTCRFCGVQLQ